MSRFDTLSLQNMFRALFIAYLALLSWQLLTPVTIVSAGSWDKAIHFSGFFVLGGLLMLAKWDVAVARLVSALLLYAALTEILQYFIPGRSFSVLDWVADSLGVIVAVLISSIVLNRSFRSGRSFVWKMK